MPVGHGSRIMFPCSGADQHPRPAPGVARTNTTRPSRLVAPFRGERRWRRPFFSVHDSNWKQTGYNGFGGGWDEGWVERRQLLGFAMEFYQTNKEGARKGREVSETQHKLRSTQPTHCRSPKAIITRKQRIGGRSSECAKRSPPLLLSMPDYARNECRKCHFKSRWSCVRLLTEASSSKNSPAKDQIHIFRKNRQPFRLSHEPE